MAGALGLGFVAVSDDLGATWVPPIFHPLTEVIVDAHLMGYATLPVGGEVDIVLGIVPYGFAVYRNGRRLFRNDGTGVDYSYNSSTMIATLALPFRASEVLAVDIALNLGVDVYEIGETPSGAINGANNVFTLAHTPTGNVRLFSNGGRTFSQGTDFTMSGSTITTTSFVPQTGDILAADYCHS